MTKLLESAEAELYSSPIVSDDPVVSNTYVVPAVIEMRKKSYKSVDVSVCGPWVCTVAVGVSHVPPAPVSSPGSESSPRTGFAPSGPYCVRFLYAVNDPALTVNTHERL